MLDIVMFYISPGRTALSQHFLSLIFMFESRCLFYVCWKMSSDARISGNLTGNLYNMNKIYLSSQATHLWISETFSRRNVCLQFAISECRTWLTWLKANLNNHLTDGCKDFLLWPLAWIWPGSGTGLQGALTLLSLL